MFEWNSGHFQRRHGWIGSSGSSGNRQVQHLRLEQGREDIPPYLWHGHQPQNGQRQPVVHCLHHSLVSRLRRCLLDFLSQRQSVREKDWECRQDICLQNIILELWRSNESIVYYIHSTWNNNNEIPPINQTHTNLWHRNRSSLHHQPPEKLLGNNPRKIQQP